MITASMNDYHFARVIQPSWENFIPFFPEPVVNTIFTTYFKQQVAIIRQREPNLSDRVVYYRATKETYHLILDGAGMVPGAGEVIDIGHSGIYAIEGDNVNASISLASAIPFVGWSSAGGKIAYKVSSATLSNGNTVQLTSKFITTAGGVVLPVRSSKNFRKGLGLIAGDNTIGHHILPHILAKHGLIQKTFSATPNYIMDLGDPLVNGIPLSKTLHAGNHENYTRQVRSMLDNGIAALGGNIDNITPAAAQQKLVDICTTIKTRLALQPNVNINDAIIDY